MALSHGTDRGLLIMIDFSIGNFLHAFLYNHSYYGQSVGGDCRAWLVKKQQRNLADRFSGPTRIIYLVMLWVLFAPQAVNPLTRQQLFYPPMCPDLVT